MLKPNALPFIFAMTPVGPGIDKKPEAIWYQTLLGNNICDLYLMYGKTLNFFSAWDMLDTGTQKL